MGSFSGEEILGNRAAFKASVSDSDRALLLATAAWGDQCGQTDTSTDPNERTTRLLAGVRDRLAPAWLQALEWAVDRDGTPECSTDRFRAIDELRRLHRASANVDLARVHSSWLVRALQEESPAVQRLVTASLAEAVRHRVQAGLLLDSRDLQSERPPAALVASWVMALWTERLVGGEPERSLDPPALAVLVRLTPRAGYRLCRMAGLCKLVLVSELPGDRHGTPGEQARYDWLAARLADADDDARALAKGDVAASRSSRIPLRHQPARIGLATVARLLSDTEPFRLRWALQHWPYPIAKLIRSVLASSTSGSAPLHEAESLILRTAWDRLNLEGRLEPLWPEPRPSTVRRSAADPIAARPIGPESSLFRTS